MTMPTTSALPRFRGQDTCIRRAYMTITSSAYGRGSTFTFGALSRNANFTKNGQLTFPDTALTQALSRLEKFGVIEFVGLSSVDESRLNRRRYRVLTDRDPAALGLRTKSRIAQTTTPAEPADVVTTPTDTGLEARVKDLEDRVNSLVKQLQAVSV